MVNSVVKKVGNILLCVCNVARSALVLFALLGMWGECSAKEIYKYKDERGRWVFSDKKPHQENYERQALVVTEQQAKISVVNRGSQEKPILYAVNRTAGPAQIWLEFVKKNNISINVPWDKEWIVPAQQDVYLLNVAPRNSGSFWEYQVKSHHIFGPPLNKLPEQSGTIDVPFRGGPFIVSQSFLGEASHKQHVESHYAVDIQMPEGTQIVAVEEGVVMDLERDFSRSGWTEEYADEANFVRVLHPDGTMAVYAHLKPNSISVHLGQSVKRGTVLGVSGNTGYSTGPHLHFVLQYNGNKKLKSLPFQFRGFSREPKVGDLLR